MNRRFVLTVFALFPLLLSDVASGEAIDNSKIGKLATSLGMSSEHAQAGVGAILKLSKVRLEPADYARIAAVFPRGDEYIALATRLGAFKGAVPSASGLNSALGAIGITPDQASRFVPTVTDYVAKAAGADVGMLLEHSLK